MSRYKSKCERCGGLITIEGTTDVTHADLAWCVTELGDRLATLEQVITNSNSNEGNDA